MNKLLLTVALVFAGYVGLTQFNDSSNDPVSISTSSNPEPSSNSDSLLASAFEHKTSNLQIEGKGTVTKILKDDTDGSRHQRFIIRLDSGQTLLVAHNIDLAPRINALREGDTLSFYGEYEWSAKGGVIHWTHRDPRGRHVAGWLKHNGQMYQ